MKKINAKIAKHGIEMVKCPGYFYFADIGKEFVADRIASIYQNSLAGLTPSNVLAHVETELSA